jgi:hypothetical protein
VSDSFTPEDVARRLGQIEHLLNEVLERQERNSVKNRLGLERAIEKVGLEIADHRELIEGAYHFSSERITEKELDTRLFERGVQAWDVVGLSPIADQNESGENLFLVVFRQSVYYESQETDDAVKSNK